MSNEETASLSFIERAASEIKAYTGIFLNLKTGSVWSLVLNEAELLVEVPHFSFKLAPLSRTKFRPVNPIIKLEFEFENNDSRNSLLINPWLMHIYAKDVRRATFEALR
jgi:hypothetical protein